MSDDIAIVKVELIHGPEGRCLAINDTRVAGPKPWGGGHVLNSWLVRRAEILEAIGAAEKPDA